MSNLPIFRSHGTGKITDETGESGHSLAAAAAAAAAKLATIEPHQDSIRNVSHNHAPMESNSAETSRTMNTHISAFGGALAPDMIAYGMLNSQVHDPQKTPKPHRSAHGIMSIQKDDPKNHEAHGHYNISNLQGLNDSDAVQASNTSTEKTGPGTAHMQLKEPGGRAFVCEVCGWRFALKGNLIAHVRRHTGEKPYICGTCNRKFTQSSLLTVHLRTHSGEKPFSCTICNRTFSRSSNLSTHMRTHTDNKPYECSFCQKRFSQRVNMELHTRVHTGVKPYRCGVCNRAFTSCSNMRRHWRHIHPNHPEPAPGTTYLQQNVAEKPTGIESMLQIDQGVKKTQESNEVYQKDQLLSFKNSLNLTQFNVPNNANAFSGVQLSSNVPLATAISGSNGGVLNTGQPYQLQNFVLNQLVDQRLQPTAPGHTISSHISPSDFLASQRQAYSHHHQTLASDIQIQSPVPLLGQALTRSQSFGSHSRMPNLHVLAQLPVDIGTRGHFTQHSTLKADSSTYTCHPQEAFNPTIKDEDRSLPVQQM